MQDVLSEEQIRKSLEALDGWSYEGGELVRTYQLSSFVEAIEFVRRVAGAAEEAQHHPDIDIRYDSVKLSLSTHSAGGVTGKDFRLAERVETLL